MKHRHMAGAGSALALSAAVAATIFGGSASAAPAAQAAKCLHPTKTTVAVKMYEMGFTLKPAGAIRCGTITFKQVNTGSVAHNFDMQGHKAGKLLQPKQTTVFTLTLKPGRFQYVCDVLGHAQSGMAGTLRVK